MRASLGNPDELDLPLDGKTTLVAKWLDWASWESGPDRKPIERTGIVTAKPSGFESYTITNVMGAKSQRRRKNVHLTPCSRATQGAIATAEAQDAIRRAAANQGPQGIDKIVEIIETAVSFIPSTAWEQAIRAGYIGPGGGDDDAWIGQLGVKLEIIPYGMKVWVNKGAIYHWVSDLRDQGRHVPADGAVGNSPPWLERVVQIIGGDADSF